MKMRFLSVVVAVCLSASAQENPAKNPLFLALNGLYAASAAVDGHSTQGMLSRGNREANPLLGPYPSTPRIWATGTAITAGVILLDYKLAKRSRWLWIVPPLAGIALHSALAAHNYQLE